MVLEEVFAQSCSQVNTSARRRRASRQKPSSQPARTVWQLFSRRRTLGLKESKHCQSNCQSEYLNSYV